MKDQKEQAGILAVLDATGMVVGTWLSGALIVLAVLVLARWIVGEAPLGFWAGSAIGFAGIVVGASMVSVIAHRICAMPVAPPVRRAPTDLDWEPLPEGVRAEYRLVVYSGAADLEGKLWALSSGGGRYLGHLRADQLRRLLDAIEDVVGTPRVA